MLTCLFQDICTCCLQSDAAKKKKTDEPTEDVVPEEDKVLCCNRNPESEHSQIHMASSCIRVQLCVYWLNVLGWVIQSMIELTRD